MKTTKEKLLVAKIGGNIIEDEKALAKFLYHFSKIKEKKILIHGGGKTATQLATKLGIETQILEGRRITTKESLDPIIMTYAGLINKKIVANLQSNECNALGFTGADGNVIRAEKRPVKNIDYGYVGDVVEINTALIDTILYQGITPVFCAITHNGKGELYNTNADTIAAEIAAAMSINNQVSLYYCFELKGVLQDINDKDSVIEHINLEKYTELKDNKAIHSGMIPKLQNCFNALHKNVDKVHIANEKYIEDTTIKHTTISL